MTSNILQYRIHQLLLFYLAQISLQNRDKFDKTSHSLGVFKYDMGVLRCGGRLKNSALPLDTMHPMILPPEHHVTRLIIDKAHVDVP